MSIPWFMPTAVSRLSCAPGLYRSNTCAHARKPTHVLCVLYNKARLRQVFIISQRSSGNGRSHFVREHLFGKCSLFCFIYLQSVGQSQALKGTQTTNQRGLPKYHTGAFSLRISRIQFAPSDTQTCTHSPTPDQPRATARCNGLQR